MKRTNKKGFTIVELVVVIAVIAILAAIMIPTFSGIVGDAEDAAAQAEAKAQYTQFMSKEDNLDKTVNYVLIEGVYYNVADNFEVATPTHGATILENGEIAAKTYCSATAGECTETDCWNNN